jgi:hypothetical protein
VGGLPIIHHRTLAKFGYRLERKVERIKYKYGDFKKKEKTLKYCNSGSFFSQKQISVWVALLKRKKKKKEDAKFHHERNNSLQWNFPFFSK